MSKIKNPGSKNRVPVKYKGRVLMPMLWRRARMFIKAGKARKRYDRKTNITWLQLLVEPSDMETQAISLGIDPGSVFDGYSVVSKECHHHNHEHINREKNGKNSIKARLETKAMYKNTRNGKKWHRKQRFDNRTGSKVTPTIRANVQSRIRLISTFIKYYPITNIVVEDVAFNHRESDEGSSFSLVEQGKTMLYNWIIDTHIHLDQIKGHETHKLRRLYFGIDPKKKGLETKGDMTFEAHCIDSFVIAANNIGFKGVQINKAFTLEKRMAPVKRALVRTKKTSQKSVGMCKLKKIRVKIADNLSDVAGVKSNHGPWEYMIQAQSGEPRFKQHQEIYGGTGRIRSLSNKRFTKFGMHKFFIQNQYCNRSIAYIMGNGKGKMVVRRPDKKISSTGKLYQNQIKIEVVA